MNLANLFDPALLRQCLNDRLVTARRHPSAALTILNYSERCHFESGHWNAVTLACRGLIHDINGEIVARPFRKFFNYGDRDAPQLDPTEPVTTTDKLDGSLGILYRIGNSHAIATRGAFESEQALHATEVWRERHSILHVPAGVTFLFEIVYPENRIVVDYAGMDALILLGAVDIESGQSLSPSAAGVLLEWAGPLARTFEHRTLTDALAASPRTNAEGLVIHVHSTDERIKLKQEDYKTLHRIVTGLNERSVWEHCASGQPIEVLLEKLPDEFQGWAREVAARLTARVDDDAAEIEQAYSTILGALPPGHSRKDFALVATTTPFASALFARRDGKDYRTGLWKAIRPEGRLGPRGLAPAEETA